MSAGFAAQVLIAISGIIGARLLGPEDRGFLALLLIYPSVVAQVGSLGISLAITHHIARTPAVAVPLLRSQLVPIALQVAVLTCVHALIVLEYSSGKPDDVKVAAVISLAAVPATYLSHYGLAVLQGRREYRSLNVWRLAPPFGYVAGLLVLVAAGGGTLVELTAASVGSGLLAGALVVFVVARRVYRERASDDADKRVPAPPRGEIYRFGAASYLGYVSPLDSFRLDQLFVGLVLGPVQLGLYVVAVAFMNLPRFVGQSLGLVAAPHLATLAGQDELRAAARRFVKTGVVACAAIAAGVGATLQWTLPFLFGEEYAGAIGTGRVLLLAAFFLGVRRIATDCARGAGLPRLGASAEIASLLSFAATAPPLAFAWGVVGVAWALAIGSLTGCLALTFTLRPWLRVRDLP